jgi:hypothetical protein
VTLSLPRKARRTVGSDAIEPGTEGSLSAEALDGLEGSQVGLLHHIARIVDISGQTHGQGEGVLVGSLH